MLGVFSTTGVVFMLIGLGYAAVFKGMFTPADLRILGRYIVNLALPALVFRAVTGPDLGEILEFGYLFPYAVGSLLAFGAAYALGRVVLQLPSLTATFQAMGSSCSNSGFIGYPIMLMVLPPVAPAVVALSMTVENLVMIPIVLILAERARGEGVRGWALAARIFGRLLLGNPIVLALIVGLVVALSGLELPALVSRPIGLIADSSAAVSLIVIGGTLVGLPLGAVDRGVISVVAGKLIGFPLAVAFAFLVFGAVGLGPGNPDLARAAILNAAMPAAGIYPILAQRYGEEARAALAMLVMTVLSFFTMSAVMLILGLGVPAA
ncbi:MAG: AEC family transporter [Rhodobacteraceae bacterium]|nr:AEC family transporter [Paracoccaceae bacterium]